MSRIVVCNDFEIEISLNGDRVEHLFNDANSETFDLTEAVSAEVNNTLVQIETGDTLTFIAVKE